MIDGRVDHIGIYVCIAIRTVATAWPAQLSRRACTSTLGLARTDGQPETVGTEPR